MKLRKRKKYFLLLLSAPIFFSIMTKRPEGTSIESSYKGVSALTFLYTTFIILFIVDDFIIEFAAENFLDLAGIKSPGLSAAPAIAVEAVKMLAEKGLELNKKENVIDSRKHLRFKKLSNEEKNRVIAENPAYGRVICRCETITEGEIIDALKSPIPPVSLDGIKRRAGTGMGRCQSGFCGPKVLEIIAKFRNVPYEDVLQDNTGSYILVGETKSGGAK